MSLTDCLSSLIAARLLSGSFAAYAYQTPFVQSAVHGNADAATCIAGFRIMRGSMNHLVIHIERVQIPSHSDHLHRQHPSCPPARLPTCPPAGADGRTWPYGSPSRHPGAEVSRGGRSSRASPTPLQRTRGGLRAGPQRLLSEALPRLPTRLLCLENPTTHVGEQILGMGGYGGSTKAQPILHCSACAWHAYCRPHVPAHQLIASAA